MTTDEILKQILSNTYTKADCYRRLLLLQDFFDQTGSKAEGLIKPKGFSEPERSERIEGKAGSDEVAAVAAWGEEALAELAGQRELIADIKRRIEALPELVLYVPSVLARTRIDQLGSWCRTHVQSDVLLVLHSDSAYVGGCALVWKDLFYDFSLSYAMHKHQRALTELLNAERI